MTRVMSHVGRFAFQRARYRGPAKASALAMVIVVSIMMTGVLADRSQAAGPDLAGLWIDHTKRGAVEIELCSKMKTGSRGKDKTALCGRIFWMIKEHDKNGNPYRDKLNKRKSKRKRPLCGLTILGNVKRISSRVYDGGWIYDHDQGKAFDLELRLKSRNILQVKGYLGTKLFSKTFYWRRARKELKRCSPEPLG